jgi:uncharacterized surface protein with fasciclin (FAS1) repeats
MTFLHRATHRATTGKGTRALAIGSAALLLVASACGDDDADVGTVAETADVAVTDAVEQAETTQADLASTLRDNYLDTIAGFVERVDLSQVFDTDEFTFFAPNDAAFTSLSADEIADLLSQPDTIVDILRNHTLDERVTSTDLTTRGEVTTEEGQTLIVTADGGTVTLDGATVVTTDIDAGGGIVHVVDSLLVP